MTIEKIGKNFVALHLICILFALRSSTKALISIWHEWWFFSWIFRPCHVLTGASSWTCEQQARGALEYSCSLESLDIVCTDNRFQLWRHSSMLFCWLSDYMRILYLGIYIYWLLRFEVIIWPFLLPSFDESVCALLSNRRVWRPSSNCYICMASPLS